MIRQGWGGGGGGGGGVGGGVKKYPESLFCLTPP